MNDFEQLCDTEKERKAKHAAYMRTWNAKNRDKKLAGDQKWRAANPEKKNAGNRARYHRNRERMLAYNAEYRAKNPEKISQYSRRWYYANPEKVKAFASAAYCKNPVGMRANVELRRARKLSATIVEFAGADIATHYATKYPGIGCYVCALLDKGPGKYEADDHIVALSKGGPHSLENLAPICRSHNASKCAKDLNQWIDDIRRREGTK